MGPNPVSSTCDRGVREPRLKYAQGHTPSVAWDGNAAPLTHSLGVG